MLNAVSFTMAEALITQVMQQYCTGEFTIKDIKKASYSEIFFMNRAEKIFNNEVDELSRALNKGDKEKATEVFKRPILEQNNTDSRWYKAKLQFITIDEKTEKEKRSNAFYLVEGTSLNNAIDNLNLTMKNSLLDYEACNISVTQFIDVFEFVPAEKEEE